MNIEQQKSKKNEKTPGNLIIVVIAIVLPTFVTLTYFQWLEKYPASVEQTAYAVGKAIQFALPVVWVWLFFRYRFNRKERVAAEPIELAGMKLPHWFMAIGFGIDVCILMGIAYWSLSGTEMITEMTLEVQDKVCGLGIDTAWKFALLGIFYSLVHSFLEEYYWRWFVYDLLKRFVAIPVANVISSLGFMAHHVVLLSVYFGWDSPMTWLCSAGVAIGGMYWAWLYEKSGTLKWSWLSHMVVDAGIFSLGYFLVRGTFV